MDPRDFPRHLRNNATPEERAVWNAFARIRPRFTRQLRIHPHIADFACRRAKLLVEVDGSQHADSHRDDLRTAELEAAGWRVIRFWNSEVQSNLEGVVQAVIEAGNARLPVGEAFEFLPSRAGRERKPKARK